MESKTQFYRALGNGRDSYISFNNGGMFAATQPMPEYPVTSFPARRTVRHSANSSPQRTIRYRTNGTGRDLYISSNAGGFESRTLRFCPGAVFYKSLRETELLRSYDTRDYLRMQRDWMPMRTQSLLRLRGKRQKITAERLCQPKGKTEEVTRK